VILAALFATAASQTACTCEFGCNGACSDCCPFGSSFSNCSNPSGCCNSVKKTTVNPMLPHCPISTSTKATETPPPVKNTTTAKTTVTPTINRCPEPQGAFTNSCDGCTITGDCCLDCACDSGNGIRVDATFGLNRRCSDGTLDLNNENGVLTCADGSGTSTCNPNPDPNPQLLGCFYDCAPGGYGPCSTATRDLPFQYCTAGVNDSAGDCNLDPRVPSFQQGHSQAASRVMTPQICSAICSWSKFFGLQNGHACFCGNSYGNQGGQAPDDDCNLPCSGDPNSICGGPCRNSIYSHSPLN